MKRRKPRMVKVVDDMESSLVNAELTEDGRDVKIEAIAGYASNWAEFAPKTIRSIAANLLKLADAAEHNRKVEAAK